MRRIHYFSEEQRGEIKQARVENKDKRVELRLHALELRARTDMTYDQIAGYLHINPKVVGHWISRYMRNGLEDITVLRYGGHHRNLSHEKEEAFLSKYEERADKGQIISTKEMKQEYDELIGHKSGGGTLYRLMKRHKWRKVMPRSKHPKKASDAEIQAVKNKIFFGASQASESR
jgi:transposase